MHPRASKQISISGSLADGVSVELHSADYCMITVRSDTGDFVRENLTSSHRAGATRNFFSECRKCLPSQPRGSLYVTGRDGADRETERGQKQRGR